VFITANSSAAELANIADLAAMDASLIPAVISQLNQYSHSTRVAIVALGIGAEYREPKLRIGSGQRQSYSVSCSGRDRNGLSGQSESLICCSRQTKSSTSDKTRRAFGTKTNTKSSQVKSLLATYFARAVILLMLTHG
jgi:hypothetical protein